MGEGSKVRRARPSVLVIDDDRMVAASIVDVLSPSSDVTVAHSASDAAARLSGSAFDAIVCDLMMPGTSGIDLYRALLEADPGTARRMIFVTGGAFTNEAMTFLENTAQPCLEKPFSPEELSAAIVRVAGAR